MKYSLGMYNILEEISSITHFIVFFYFFALVTEKGFIFSYFLSFYNGCPQTTILPCCISFSWGWSLSLPLVQCQESPSIVGQALCLLHLIP